MKVSFDIDCTPEEARRFFGLPDVKPMQDVLIQEMQERIRTTMQSMKNEDLMSNWMKAGFGGFGGDANSSLQAQFAKLAPNLDLGQQGIEQMTQFWSQVLQQAQQKPNDKT